MNDEYDNARTDLDMLERYKAEELAQINAMIADIMAAIPVSARTLALENAIRKVVVRHIQAANDRYAEQMVAEETHDPGPGWDPHPNRLCQPDFCGRYAGQRRDT